MFLVKENLSAEEIKEAEVLSWWNSNEKNTYFARFRRTYLLALHLLFILKDYFHKLVACKNKSKIDCFQKQEKTHISSSQFEKQERVSL